MRDELDLPICVALARLDVEQASDVLRTLAGQLLDAGAVTAGFPEALQARELRYPTGLPTPIPTAIPHADPEHVREECLAVATLAHPVAFGEMGAAHGSTVEVRLVAMPLLRDAHGQVTALARLMAVLTDEQAVAALLEAADDEDLARRAALLLTPTEVDRDAGARDAGARDVGSTEGEPARDADGGAA